MVFTQVAFLIGAVAVGAPLLIHLLARPRYKRVPFAMLRFLHKGELESQSRRRLQNFLILLIRCAAVILIVLLFAQPSLVEAERGLGARDAHFLIVDNSWSMTYGDFLEKAKSAARKHIEEAPAGSVFHVYAVSSKTFEKDLGRKAALRAVDSIAPSALPPDAEPALAAVRATVGAEDHGPVQVFVAGDFTPAFLQQLKAVEKPIDVNGVAYEVVRAEKVSNAAVVEAHLEASADERLRINVAVANYGQDPQKRRLVARAGDKEVARAEVMCNPGERHAATLAIPADLFADGYGALEFSLEPADALPGDDTYYFGFVLPRTTGKDVTILARDTREAFLVRSALATYAKLNPLESINVRQVLHANAASGVLGSTNVVLVTSLPPDPKSVFANAAGFFGRGGVLVFFLDPAQAQALSALAGLDLTPVKFGEFHRQVLHVAENSAAASGDPLDPDGRLLRALWNYEIGRVPLEGFVDCEALSDTVCLWKLDNDAGFIYRRPAGNGCTLFVNTSADDALGGLMKSPAAVAFCRYLLGPGAIPRTLAYRCGATVRIPATALETEAAGETPSGWVETSASQRERVPIVGSDLAAPPLATPGWTRTVSKPVRAAGSNPAEGETDLTSPSSDAVAGEMARVFTVSDAPTTAVAAGKEPKRESKPLWKWMGWFAVGLLMTEALLANRMKR